MSISQGASFLCISQGASFSYSPEQGTSISFLLSKVRPFLFFIIQGAFVSFFILPRCVHFFHSPKVRHFLFSKGRSSTRYVFSPIPVNKKGESANSPLALKTQVNTLLPLTLPKQLADDVLSPLWEGTSFFLGRAALVKGGCPAPTFSWSLG